MTKHFHLFQNILVNHTVSLQNYKTDTHTMTYLPSAEFAPNLSDKYQIPAFQTLSCWDMIALSPQYLLLKNKEAYQDFLEFREWANIHHWQEIPDVVPYLVYNKYAVVITNMSGMIDWVSAGFKQMTGYTKKEVLHYSPKFLQGKATSKETSDYISSHLKEGKEVSATVINYKKSGKEYNCELHIFPMHNTQNNLTHFLALEREV